MLNNMLSADMCGAQIHWFSIINSCVTVLLLTGFLATILMRVLKNDFLKYSRDEDGARATCQKVVTVPACTTLPLIAGQRQSGPMIGATQSFKSAATSFAPGVSPWSAEFTLDAMPCTADSNRSIRAQCRLSPQSCRLCSAYLGYNNKGLHPLDGAAGDDQALQAVAQDQ